MGVYWSPDDLIDQRGSVGVQDASMAGMAPGARPCVTQLIRLM